MFIFPLVKFHIGRSSTWGQLVQNESCVAVFLKNYFGLSWFPISRNKYQLEQQADEMLVLDAVLFLSFC